jgi:pimeloyl-ACP methyl ester carboxylesterase
LGDARIVAPDARGHGLSSASRAPTDYSVGELASDVLCIADHLEIDRFALLGFSMGARTAARVASLHPDRVAALGIFAPPPDTMDSAGARLFISISEKIERDGFNSAVESLHVTRPELARMMLNTPRQGLGAALRGLHDKEFALSSRELVAIQCPTIVVGLENDPHPLATAERYARDIPGAQFRLSRWADRKSELPKLAADVLSLSDQ